VNRPLLRTILERRQCYAVQTLQQYDASYTFNTAFACPGEAPVTSSLKSDVPYSGPSQLIRAGSVNLIIRARS
jgi:hypothetical protein